MPDAALPSRRLCGVLFGAAGAIWWLMISLLFLLIAPEKPVFSPSFWLGGLLLVATAAGWGAALGRPLARRARRVTPAAGVLLSSVAGVGLLLLAGGTALGGSLALGALIAGSGPVSAVLHTAAAQPGRLVLPVVSLLLIAAPFGGAAGVALRAMAAPAAGGSAGSSPR